MDWKAGLEGSPLLNGAIAVIECRVSKRFDAGDHRVLVGEAISARTHEGKPLLYFRSGYRNVEV